MLRSTDLVQWYIVPLIVILFWAYSIEIKKKNLKKVLLGINFFCIEFIWEMTNALVAYFGGYSGFWLCSPNTAFMITVGYTIEIAFFFGIAPFIIFNFLDGWEKEDTFTIFGKEINNRRIIPLIIGFLCVFIEIILNFMGLLIWDWWWWSWYFPFLQLFVYSAPWYLLTWLYDKDKLDLLKKWTPVIVITTISLWITLTSLGWV